MKRRFLIALSPLCATVGCGAFVGSTGQDTSFEREGTLNCEGIDISAQDLVQGTTANPVRCGPQSQPISG